jgi:hypothetical protein
MMGWAMMISAFQSKEFGFGVDVSEIESGVCKDGYKKPLTSSPFITTWCCSWKIF